jgi:hypothetical protein
MQPRPRSQRSAWARISFRLAALVAVAALVAGCSAAGPAATSTPSAPPVSTRPTAPPSVAPHQGLAGRVLLGPMCPVERVPPDPQCAPRAIAGAVILVLDAGGREVARTTSTASGTYALDLGPGSYTVTAQPVAGVLGTPGPQQVTIPTAGPGPTLDLQYDTGIR